MISACLSSTSHVGVWDLAETELDCKTLIIPKSVVFNEGDGGCCLSKITTVLTLALVLTSILVCENVSGQRIVGAKVGDWAEYVYLYSGNGTLPSSQERPESM
jgi:hypothetical protein